MIGIRELRKAAQEYQALLGLTEWTIHVRWGEPAEKPDYDKGQMDEGSVGNALWHAEECEAWVYLKRGAPDPQATLLHELLHIRLEGHKQPVRYDAMYERAINAIASALRR